jgi:outer membrane biosynthesis protein TonB
MDASPSQRPWISLTLSAALHAALLVLAVLLTREHGEKPSGKQQAVPEPGRETQMVYLEPPARTPPPRPPDPQPPKQPPPPQLPPQPPQPPAVPPRAMAPPPEKEQRTPEPDANAPPEAKRAEGEEATRDDPAGGERASADTRRGSPAATNPAAVTMESEAKRIFGSPEPGTRLGAGPRAVRPMEAYLPDHPERCIPRPSAPADSAGATQYGVVVGKIFRKDDGKPLSGAHLQMLGTPYVTFTDPAGEYRFRFDMALVDNCRTQYVRVTAPGYESRLLVLMVGANVRSEDVLLKAR